MTCSICDRVGGPLVECAACGLRKHPFGRDPGVAAANGYCGFDCHSYSEEPFPGGLWPGERVGDVYGHEDWHDEVNRAAAPPGGAREETP